MICGTTTDSSSGNASSRSWEARFWRRVYKDAGDGCWLWLGPPNSAGYGQIRLGAQLLYVHRVALVLAGHPLGPGIYGLHDCNTKLCVRVGPGHLKPGSQSENMTHWHQTKQRMYNQPSPLLELPL